MLKQTGWGGEGGKEAGGRREDEKEAGGKREGGKEAGGRREGGKETARSGVASWFLLITVFNWHSLYTGSR